MNSLLWRDAITMSVSEPEVVITVQEPHHAVGDEDVEGLSPT
jgi:hypothetical protein